jgi:DNA-binding SARP family transcriptional activator/WD40 repeat protein
MRIAVLGPLEVLTDDGTPVPVPGAKERLLLAVLAAGAPDVVSADRLMDTLWADAQPITARKSLQAHLVRLRSSLEPGRPRGSTGRYVVRRGAGYALSLDRASIDALRMPDLAARGRAQLTTGHAAEAERELRAALGLWRGQPYADWPDAAFAETERRRLAGVRAGAVESLLQAELAMGRHADVLPELERLVAEEPLNEGWWRLLLLALYRAGRQADALVAARRARALLSDELGADPGPALRQMEAAILDQDPALDLRSGNGQGLATDVVVAVPAGTCPYKGLSAYQVVDAPLFHGRARVVAGLVARLVDAPLVVVSGSSGAGKSSVVRAGMVPALGGGALPGSAAWRPAIVAPGRAPVDVLAGLTGDPSPAAPVLLVCDQFEELWAPGVDAAERTAFLDALLGLIEDGIVVRCVAAVRGDHVGRLAEHAAFTERLGGAVVLVPALTDPELREIVREPAQAVGLDVETELLDAVVADVLGRPGALPLLSTALVGTWERRRGDRLTLAGYLESGGVAGALTRSAEEAYAALDEPGRELARRLLVRLADVDDGGALVRRLVPLIELDLDDAGGAARREVVEAFVNRRLLSLDGDRLEVAHEALLTGWPRLVRWLEDDAAGRAVRRQLAPSARAWAEGGRPDEELYRGARLAAALDWAAGADADMTPIERQFLDASEARADAELNDARDRAHREAAARRRTRRLAIGLAAVLVVALVAAGLAAISQRAAQRASLVADANRLAALSTAVGSLDLSFLLAAQGYRLADTPQTQDGLLAALAEHRRAVRAVPFPGGALRTALSNDGRTLFLSGGPRILSWTVAPGKLPETVLGLTAEDWGSWGPAGPSPTDDVWATAGADLDSSWIRLVDADGDVHPVADTDAIGGIPMTVSFTPDGRLLNVLVVPQSAGEEPSRWQLVTFDPGGGTPHETGIAGTLPAPLDELRATVSDDGGTALFYAVDPARPATLVDLVTGEQATLKASPRDAELLDYRALRSGAAQLWDDGTLILYDRSGAVQELHAHRTEVTDVALAPDGTWAVTVSDGGEVVLWDVDARSGRWAQRESLDGHEGAVVAAEVHPDSRHLFTVAADDTVIVWDVSPDGGFGTSHQGIPGRWVADRPGVVEPGRLAVAATRSLGTVPQSMPYIGGDTVEVAATFFDPRTGAVVDQVAVGDTLPDVYYGASVAVSPDHGLVAVTSGVVTTILDSHTRELVAHVALPPDFGAGGDGNVPRGAVCCAVWSRDGSRLLLGTGGALPGLIADTAPRIKGAIAVVDTTTWELLGDPVVVDRVPEVMALSPDGRFLAMAAVNSTDIEILDAETFEVRHRIKLGVDDSVWALSFSRDGRRLAGGGEKGNLYVADTKTWEAREPVLVHNRHLLQVEWLGDDRTVISTAADGKVVLFDADRGVVRTRSLPASVDGAEGYGHLVPDPEDEIVVLNDQRVGLSYPVDPAVWLRDACAVAGRDLTRAEWDRYLPGQEYQTTCSDLG